ncbi:MAG TPA: LysM peptidoglycan-binding domain-containing protein [Anaerolineae bacterium]|nr:LysM peptidoglycan-binding domain-containing protein [Anaerolineae bacterium]
MRKAVLLLLLLAGRLALGAGLVEGAPPAEGPAVHVVQRGETLFSIARRYGTTVEAIVLANRLSDASTIYAGQHLVIPTPAGSTPSASAGHYTVRPGDTLIAIALRFGTSPVAIAQANNLRHPSLIYVGQQLAIPGAEGLSRGQKRIEIDISEQRLTAWEGETLVYDFVCSTGLPGYPTRRGRFRVLDKIPMAYSSSWNLWMPHWLGIYWAGGTENGIHALPIINGRRLWEGYLGQPISYGCIVLSTEAAEALYHWAEIGTPVVIHE